MASRELFGGRLDWPRGKGGEVVLMPWDSEWLCDLDAPGIQDAEEERWVLITPVKSDLRFQPNLE